MSAKDPLLSSAHKKLAIKNLNETNGKQKGASRVVQLTVHAVVPFVSFAFMLFLTVYAFFWWSFGIWLFVMAGLVVCYVQYLIVDHCFHEKIEWQKWIGVYSAAALLCGFGIGLYIHYDHMLFYYKYTHMTKYTNVAASQPVLQFEDASNIMFTEGTSVDTTRGLGYHDIRTAQTLCVAPVIDSQMASTDPVKFWAVGVGCCTWRASFNCDDAKSGSARTGLLILRPDQLVASSMNWTVSDKFDFEGFDNAIEMAKSVFALTVGKERRYVRWVQDANKAIDVYRRRSLESAFYACGLFILVTLFCVTKDVMNENVRQKQLADKITGIDTA